LGIETFLEQNQLLVLIAIIMLGYTLGYIKIKGVSLGASACLFVAVAAGWLGARLPHIITMPIVILGIAITTITMTVSTFFAKKFLGLSTKSSMGITCGTMTSTPALGIMIKNFKRRVAGNRICKRLSGCGDYTHGTGKYSCMGGLRIYINN